MKYHAASKSSGQVYRFTPTQWRKFLASVNAGMTPDPAAYGAQTIYLTISDVDTLDAGEARNLIADSLVEEAKAARPAGEGE